MRRYEADEITKRPDELGRVLRCVNMAMGCISPLSKNPDERLAWYRLLDAMEGREPRNRL
jgi:hypothetical protein